MKVERITVTRPDGSGSSSHIEPPFDLAWPYEKQLEWHAAVATEDSGIDCWIEPSNATCDGRPVGGWNVYVGGTSSGPHMGHQVAKYLRGVVVGAREVRMQQ